MVTGSAISKRRPSEVLDRLKLAMAAGNFQIVEVTDNSISFNHGTYLTQTADLICKHGTIRIEPSGEQTQVLYEVELSRLARCFLIACAVLFCWTVVTPILAHRVMVYHPRRLMENLLQAI